MTNEKYFGNKEEFIKQMNLQKYKYKEYDSGEPNSIKRLIFLHNNYIENEEVKPYRWDRGLWLCFISDVLGNNILSTEEVDKFAENVSESKYK